MDCGVSPKCPITGTPALRYPGNRILYFQSAFEFHGMCARFFHDPDCGVQRLSGISLVRSKRQIHDNQRPFYGPHYRSSMVDHLVDRDRQRRFVAGHYIGSRIAHQDQLDACCIHNARHRVIVGGKAGYFFATRFHFLNDVGCNAFDIRGMYIDIGFGLKFTVSGGQLIYCHFTSLYDH
jgi:hypothetical protein